MIDHFKPTYIDEEREREKEKKRKRVRKESHIDGKGGEKRERSQEVGEDGREASDEGRQDQEATAASAPAAAPTAPVASTEAMDVGGCKGQGDGEDHCSLPRRNGFVESNGGAGGGGGPGGGGDVLSSASCLGYERSFSASGCICVFQVYLQ